MTLSKDIVRGLIFAGLMIVIPIGLQLAAKAGLADSGWAWRALMALVGVFLVLRGNEIPKKLTPIASGRCDPIRAQRVQRVAGWAWFITGAALVVIWLTLPLALAQTLSWFVLPVTLYCAFDAIRLCRSGGAAA